MRNSSILLTILFSSLFGLITLPVHADYCQGQYGQNCQTSSISINKMVGKPGTQDYVDNLSMDDAKFHTNDTIMFKVVITNPSQQVLTNVVFTDKLPSYLKATVGPGNYDDPSKTITYNVGTMNPGDERDLSIQTKVNTQPGIDTCVNNTATAKSDNASDTDTAQVCLAGTGGVVNGTSTITQVPSTGPELGLALMGSELGLLGLGFALKKKLS